MKNSIDVPLSSVMKNMTLHVNITEVRSNKLRIWLGVKLIYVAALVMGTGFRVER